MKEVLTMKELAEKTGLSYWFWWKQSKEGNVPCIRAGNKILFRWTTIEKWFSEQEAASIKYKTEPEQPQIGVLRKIK